MLLNQGIFATFHSNYTQESYLDPSSNRINMEHPIWGLHLQNCPLSSSGERSSPGVFHKAEKGKQTLGGSQVHHKDFTPVTFK